MIIRDIDPTEIALFMTKPEELRTIAIIIITKWVNEVASNIKTLGVKDRTNCSWGRHQVLIKSFAEIFPCINNNHQS
jgi:hypothetical protein